MSASEQGKPASLASQVSRAVIWNTIFVPLRLIAEVLSTLVKLNFLSQAGYGLLALIGGANNGLGTAVDMGTTRALPKYIPEVSRSGGPRAVLRLLTTIFAAQMLVLAVLAAGLATAFRQSYLDVLRGQVIADTRLGINDQSQLLELLGGYSWTVIGSIVALLFLGVCYDMLMAYLNSFFRQRAWNSIALAAGVLPQLLSVAAILILPGDRWDVMGVLVATVAAPAIAVALAGWQVLRLWRSPEIQAATPIEATGKRSGPLLPPGFIPYTSVSFLMTATDVIASVNFAIYLAGAVSNAALLKAGASVAGMALGYLYTPMVGVQVPLFTRVRQGEGGTLNGAYQSLVRLQLLLLVPGGVGLILLARSALIVIAPQYQEAAPIVWVLVICLFAECLLTTAHNALIVYERLSIIVISRLLTLLVVVPLAILLPPRFGLVGVTLAFGLARVAAGLWVTISGMRLLGLRWPWAFTLRVVLATALMGVLVFGLRALLPTPVAEVTLAGKLRELLAVPLGWPAYVAVKISLADKLREALLFIGAAGLGGLGFFGALRLLGGLDAQDRAQIAKMKLPMKRWLLKVL